MELAATVETEVEIEADWSVTGVAVSVRPLVRESTGVEVFV